MHVLRAARAFTGRAKIIKTEGGYHGTTDVFEASVDPNLKKAGTLDKIKVIPESKGVSANALKDVLVVPFNDVERTKKVIEENYKDVACFIIEPIMGSAGQITPLPGYLEAVRELTEKYGILLIFDEVVTGRLSYGGAQELFGVTPDLTSLGKIIGGGIPVGAFGGRRDIMKLYDPRGKEDVPLRHLQRQRDYHGGGCRDDGGLRAGKGRLCQPARSKISKGTARTDH